MEVKSVLNKDIYGANLTGTGSGYGSVTKVKPTTGGTYSDGISALTPTMPKVPTNIKQNLNIKPVNSLGGGIGGTGGGVTKEGVVTGGLGVTKMPTINTPTSTQGKYSDYLSTLQTKTALKTGNNTQMPTTVQKTAAVNAATQNATAQQAESTPAPQSTSATETPATYEEYLSQQRDLLDKRKEDADRQAEAAKERAAVDAQASYAQNMATYGTNAETLAQMGLQGGGYSDYINSQAYAQKRADVQQANALEQQAKTQNNATYEEALSEINKSGIEYKEKQAEKKDGIYASLWEGAINPDSGYTEESVASIGREYGLSEEQITELQGIVAQTKEKREAEKQAAIKQAALDAINSGSVTESNLESYLDTLKGQGASNKDIADIRETYQSTCYNDYMAAITGGTLSSTKEIDDAFKAGNLSQEHYDSLKKAWNDDINTDSNAFDGYDSYEAAKRDYEEILKNSWLSAETKAKLEKSFKSYETKKYESNVSSGYNGHSSTVTLNTPNGKVTVTYGVNSKSLKKSSGNAVFNSDVYKNAGSGQVFIVNGRPYVKLNNGDLGWVNDYWGQGAYESLKNTYKGTVYEIS